MIYVGYSEKNGLLGYSRDKPHSSFDKWDSYKTLFEALESVEELKNFIGTHKKKCSKAAVDARSEVQTAHACKATEMLLHKAGLLGESECYFIIGYAEAMALPFEDALEKIENKYRDAAEHEAQRAKTNAL